MIRPLFLALLVLAGPAAAQTSALKGHDTDAPIDFDAARIEVRDKDQQASLSGDVKIRQGDLTLDADPVKLFYLRSLTGKASRIKEKKVRVVVPETTTAE